MAHLELCTVPCPRWHSVGVLRLLRTESSRRCRTNNPSRSFPSIVVLVPRSSQCVYNKRTARCTLQSPRGYRTAEFRRYQDVQWEPQPEVCVPDPLQAKGAPRQPTPLHSLRGQDRERKIS